jgi:lipoprotein-anchoring transpeptidase ErfK/SrfK
LRTVAAAIVLIASCSVIAASAARRPEHRSAASIEQAHKPGLPGRISLTPAEARAAMATGDFLRPVATILDIRSPLKYGEYRWDDVEVPAGPVWITVDLQKQLISAFRGPHEIGTAVILYGATTNETPTGTFPILAKLKDHRSVTYGNAPMPYTLRLTADGVSIHGSNVRDGYATHGCIGVPIAFAAKLFAAAAKGDQVIIVDGSRDTDS